MALPLLEITQNERVSVNPSNAPALRHRPPYGLTLGVFLAVLAFFALPLSSIPFSSHGEAREGVVVQNMVQQESYILPFRNGVDIPSKPPGFHWIAVLTAIASGDVSEFAVRFPSALTSAAAVALSFFIISLLFDISAATLGALILCTSFEWMRSASLGRVDMVFTLFTGLSLLAIYQLITSVMSARAFKLALVTLPLALTAAALTKGPAGLGIPIIIGGVFAVTCSVLEPEGFRKIYARRILLLAALGVSAMLLSCIWYYKAYLIGGDEFLHVQIMKENVARLLGTESYEAETGHHAPFYYGIVLLFAGIAPWSLLLPVALIVGVRKRRDFLTPDNRPLLFALIWCIVFFGIITVSGSKRSVYFLPAYPPTVFLLLWVLRSIANNTRWTRVIRWCVVGLSAMLCLLTLVVGIGQVTGISLPSLIPLSDRSKHEFDIVWRALMNTASSILVLAGASAISLFALQRKHGVQRSLSFVAISLLLVVFETNVAIYPALADEKSPREFMARVREIVQPETPLFQYRDNLYSSMFYAKRNLVLTTNLSEVSALPEAYVLIEKQYLTEAQENLPGATVAAESSTRNSDGRDYLVLLHHVGNKYPTTQNRE